VLGGVGLLGGMESTYCEWLLVIVVFVLLVFLHAVECLLVQHGDKLVGSSVGEFEDFVADFGGKS